MNGSNKKELFVERVYAVGKKLSEKLDKHVISASYTLLMSKWIGDHCESNELRNKGISLKSKCLLVSVQTRCLHTSERKNKKYNIMNKAFINKKSRF